MSDVVISVENLGKKYRIGQLHRHNDTLRESIVSGMQRLLRRTEAVNGKATVADTFWALKDITFEVKRGEIVGVIGRNGAGKSTLLKILSRITEPTTGWAKIDGRVGSLLEVGTGFHHELTGRENIYLSGAMLGMKKQEIDRRFEEIVDFSGVEKFIDTPIKRYSSGMNVRLGFAVAAHLEPEILIVDEVLAVGDVAFQEKCLGKMKDVSQVGRTVLFVSHNMSAVMSLCDRAMLLVDGRKELDDSAERTVEHYLESTHETHPGSEVDARTDRSGDGSARIRAVFVRDADGSAVIKSNSRLCIDIHYTSESLLKRPKFLIGIYDRQNNGVLYFDSSTDSKQPHDFPQQGMVRCVTEPLRLTPRRYYVNIAIYRDDITPADYVQRATSMDVVPSEIFGGGKLPPPHILYMAGHEWHFDGN